MRIPSIGAVILALALVFDAGVAGQRALPPPASVFGFEPGADNTLASYDQVVAYFQQVDEASDRVQLVDAGVTSQGRRFVFALVSSPANLANIDRLREIARRLANPQGLTDDQARALAHEGRAFVHIDGGLHSAEVAAPQHVPLLLDTILRRAEEPDMARILDEVVLMLWPTINPDGHQMVAEWQMANPPADDRPTPPLPRLYQEYVGHDNNRDAYMLNMIESRAVEHAWRQWEPQVVHVHHQASPFPTRIWLPPFAEPIATHAPYLISRTVNMIGMAMALGLESRGQVGATHMGTGFDAWYPGYIDYLPVFKNVAAFWTETAGSGAAPSETTLDRIRPDMRRTQSLYASPWPGGTWRLRDAVEYMHTASLSVLDFAARYREDVLYNRYQAGRDQIVRGRTEAPYAYAFPERQRDPVAVVELLRRLAFGGVQVYRYREESTVDGIRVPAGTWVIPTDQPFAAVAREVLEVQHYPEIRPSPDGPLDQPYDAAGWTLPLAMGVDMLTGTWPINYASLEPLAPPPSPRIAPAPYEGGSSGADAAPFDSVPGLGFDAVRAAAAIRPPDGRISGSGPAFAVNPAENNAFRAVNLALSAGAAVQFVPGGGGDAARYVITGLAADRQEELVRALALRAERVGAPAGPAPRRVRVGLYDVPASMDQGWTRWVLERYGFEFVRVTGEQVERGALAEVVDVLVISDESRGVLASTAGRGGRGGRGAQPDPAVTAAEAANQARVKALDAFVRGGGTLVCLNRSATFAVDRLELPVRNVVSGLTRQEFSASGSLLAVLPSRAHHVMAGMPEEAAVFFDASPVFETLEGFRGTVLARYAETGSPLRSGFLLGESHLAGRAAALDVEHGAGHIVLVGFRPQWRGQTFGSFRVLFNAALFTR